MGKEGIKTVDGIQGSEGIQTGEKSQVNNIADLLLNLTVQQSLELARLLEEKGIKPAVQQATVQVSAAPQQQEAAATEKSSYKLVLKNVGDNKVAVMKICKETFGFSLTDIKKLVDNPGSILKENVPSAEVNTFIEKFKAAGAEVVAE